jgi:16S rRNA (uracil1498-N3)-methyltransferase
MSEKPENYVSTLMPALFYQPDPVDFLTDDDARHATKTLRLGIGDAISVTDGRGTLATAIIVRADARQCAFRVTDRQTTPPRPFSIRLCVAPTKNMDRIEWLVEKATEVGVERISFFVGQHSERRTLKLDRLEKIAVAAMKQSLQTWLPVLDEAMPLAQLLPLVTDGQRYVAHLPADKQPPHLFRAAAINQPYTVLIGPEGDFSPAELILAQASGFGLVTLGHNRLRTETAALTACQILNLINA